MEWQNEGIYYRKLFDQLVTSSSVNEVVGITVGVTVNSWHTYTYG